ncbi:MAG TPA: hypothetical protein VFA48_00410 [Gammaproteobacteria bacterium]|nr:hypothetical protein [Gammaproteobacteria bacterium]
MSNGNTKACNTATISIRATAEERDAWARTAAGGGLTLSEYVRRRCRGGRLPDRSADARIHALSVLGERLQADRITEDERQALLRYIRDAILAMRDST